MAASEGDAQTLVSFHSGWVLGNREGIDYACQMLGNAGQCVVVSVDYRLAPDNKYPAAAEDSFAASCRFSAHARQLGADPAHFAVGGDSAGPNGITRASGRTRA